MFPAKSVDPGSPSVIPLNDVDLSTIPKKDTCVAGQVGYFQRRGIVNIICGETHTCVLHVDGKSGGTLYSFGFNTYGELGIGSLTPAFHINPKRMRLFPSIKESDALMSSLYCGGRTMGFLCKGELFMWGWNKYGQVGIPNDIHS